MIKNILPIFILLALPLCSGEKKTICLNMIVKNESHVITRCLESVLPIIDSWVIVDTGSTDGTEEVILSFLKAIPGELHKRPWVNFGHNREEALALAKTKGDYILFMDADDILSFSEGFKLPDLTQDFYGIPTVIQGVESLVPRIVKSSIDWHWQAAIHEYIQATCETQGERLKGVEYVVLSGGARSQDPNRYLRDIKLLQDALEKEPENRNYQFYLAGNFLVMNDLENAVKYYQIVANKGGLKEQVFLAKLYLAKIYDHRGDSFDLIKVSYREAFLESPSRVEPLYYLVQRMRKEGLYQEAYDIISLALLIGAFPRNECVLVETAVYEYGLLFEHAVLAYQTKKYRECLESSTKLLEMNGLPTSMRQEIKSIQNEVEALSKNQLQERLLELINS